MLKTLLSVSALFCLAVLCSCQKEIDSINETPLDTTQLPAGESYIPLTDSTVWIYKDSATAENDTATVLSDTWLHDNINYKKVHLVSATDDSYSYYGIKDNNYFIYGDVDGSQITMLVLNDVAAVGGSWIYDMGMINGVPARGTGTILEKNISYTVQGKMFQNVIHSQYVMAVSIAGSYITFATYDFYFAKGIGIIRLQSVVTDGTNNTTDAQELVDYTIK